MDLYEKTFTIKLTELWFTWLSWLLVCVALNIFAIKSGSIAAYLLFFLSSGLAAFSVGYAANDIAFNTIGKNKSKLAQLLILFSILGNAVLLLIVFVTLRNMVMSNI